jgi:acetyl-CoA C-acetyltransferase
VTDGAALLLLASEEAVERWQLPVLARLVDIQWAALDPTEMGLGPVHAMAPMLHRHGLETGDIDLFEINEAFAAQVLACQEAWSDRTYRREMLGDEPDQPIPDDALNPEGGAIAIGHPVGASGARLALHLALSLKRRELTFGVASLCIGGGQGGALLLRTEGGMP